MIREIRSTSQTLFFKILISALILSFAFVALWNTSHVSKINKDNNQKIIDINHTTIFKRNFLKQSKIEAKNITKQLQEKVPSSQLKQINILEVAMRTLVEDEIISAEAKKLGLMVTGSFSKNKLLSKKPSKLKFSNLLNSLQMSEKEYISNLTHSIQNSQVLKILPEQILLPNNLLKPIFYWKYEKRKIGITYLREYRKKTFFNPNKSNIISFYQDNLKGFSIPEKRDIAYVKISGITKKHIIQNYIRNNVNLKFIALENRLKIHSIKNLTKLQASNTFLEPSKHFAFNIVKDIFDIKATGKIFIIELTTDKYIVLRIDKILQKKVDNIKNADLLKKNILSTWKKKYLISLNTKFSNTIKQMISEGNIYKQENNKPLYRIVTRNVYSKKNKHNYVKKLLIKNIFDMQIGQVVYGSVSGTEPFFHTYISLEKIIPIKKDLWRRDKKSFGEKMRCVFHDSIKNTLLRGLTISSNLLRNENHFYKIISNY
jgi:hypothetical protein